MTQVGLAATLQDAAVLADVWGYGTRVALGHGEGDILAPAGITITSTQARLAINTRADRYFFTFGNRASPPDLASLAPILDFCTGPGGIGFMAASFAAPAQGRTVFQGQLFQGGRLVANLAQELSQALQGRVAIVAHGVVAAGPQAMRRHLASCREQGVALALIDAVDSQNCSAITEALESALLVGGPAWLSPRAAAAPAALVENIAVLSGALDRQTLFQLAVARNALPFLQLNVSAPDVIPAAIAWAAAQRGAIVISASAPPDRVDTSIDAARILAEIAAGLPQNNLVITGNDTASVVLHHLGVQTLTTDSTTPGGLRWFKTGARRILIKSSGQESKNLFLDEFGPQIRLNAAAQ